MFFSFVCICFSKLLHKPTLQLSGMFMIIKKKLKDNINRLPN